LALILVSRRLKIDPLALADVAVVPAALGLALGRLGNLINQELYLSTSAHVASIAKNIFIAAAAYIYLRSSGPAKPAGGTLALFLVLYGVLRFSTEYLRQQMEAPVLGLARGQWITLPILAGGVLLFIWLRRSEKKLP
jgi:phosphatidylglycerol:prolipoprotein diacylglycerol transferase